MIIADVPVTARTAPTATGRSGWNGCGTSLRKRPTLLWEMTQDAFNLTNAEMEKYFGPKPEMPPEAI